MIAACLTPKDAYLWKRLATWSMEKGNTSQVIYCLTKAMKVDLEDASVKWDCASLFVELKDYQKAAKAFDQIIASRPFHVEARKMAAKMHYKIGQGQVAIEGLEKFIAVILFMTTDIFIRFLSRRGVGLI